MKTDYIIYGLLALAIIGLGYSLYTTTNLMPSQGYAMVSTGSTDEGDVQIDLTPVGVQGGKFVVNIAANTHSIDLSQYDLRKISILEYKGGNIYPSSAPKLSGHHANGVLEFPLDNNPEKFTIAIESIPKMNRRVFEWN